MKIKKIALSAVLTALAIVLDQFLVISVPPSSFPLMQFSLGIIPIFFIAYYCGIFYSTISAVLADLLGYFLVGIAKGYPFHAGFTLNALIAGLVFSLVLLFKNKLNNKKGTTLVCLLISGLSLLSTLIFTIYFLENIGLDVAIYSTSFNLSYAMLLTIDVLNILLTIGLVLYIIVSKNNESNSIFLSYIIYHYIVTLCLTPLWVISYLDVPYLLLWVTRLIAVPIYIFVYSLLTNLILLPIKKIYKLKY